MTEWSDDGLILSVRPYGENHAIAQIITAENGRYAGMVRGGQSRKAQGYLQPATLARFVWKARLSEHLGSLSVDPISFHAARYFDDRGRLTALIAALETIETALPERYAYPNIYAGLMAFIEELRGPFWAESYVQWELHLLKALGFGLDLKSCAGGGDSNTLAYVSPRSGRAVSAAVAEPYKTRLLALPGFLVGKDEHGLTAICNGLALTGFFMDRHVFAPHHKTLPEARLRLFEHIRQLLKAKA